MQVGDGRRLAAASAAGLWLLPGLLLLLLLMMLRRRRASEEEEEDAGGDAVAMVTQLGGAELLGATAAPAPRSPPRHPPKGPGWTGTGSGGHPKALPEGGWRSLTLQSSGKTCSNVSKMFAWK